MSAWNTSWKVDGATFNVDFSWSQQFSRKLAPISYCSCALFSKSYKRRYLIRVFLLVKPFLMHSVCSQFFFYLISLLSYESTGFFVLFSALFCLQKGRSIESCDRCVFRICPTCIPWCLIQLQICVHSSCFQPPSTALWVVFSNSRQCDRLHFLGIYLTPLGV